MIDYGSVDQICHIALSRIKLGLFTKVLGNSNDLLFFQPSADQLESNRRSVVYFRIV